jgi:hypothetical protein
MSNVYINLEIRTPRKPGTPGITLERWQIGKKVPLSLAQMTVSVFEKRSKMETPLKGYYSEEQARMDEVRAKEFKRREKRRKRELVSNLNDPRPQALGRD